MNKNKLLNSFTFLILMSFISINQAKAQWSIPQNIFNLESDLDLMILKVTDWLLGITISISVLALIWGGLNYIASSGDTQKAELSKKIIYYSLIGLFVAGVSYAIVNLIVVDLLT